MLRCRTCRVAVMICSCSYSAFNLQRFHTTPTPTPVCGDSKRSPFWDRAFRRLEKEKEKQNKENQKTFKKTRGARKNKKWHILKGIFIDLSFSAPTAPILRRLSSFLCGFIAERQGYRSAQKRAPTDYQKPLSVRIKNDIKTEKIRHFSKIYAKKRLKSEEKTKTTTKHKKNIFLKKRFLSS